MSSGTQSGNGVVSITYVTPPSVTAISPTNGSTAGGTTVTITGTGFTGATGVTIGGTAATGVNVVSSTSITCTTPAHAAGTASVLVTTPNGTNAANSLFTYVAPPTVGGTSVTITGSGFTGATGVAIGGVFATGINVVNATTIICTSGARPAGPASVLVFTPVGTNTSNTLFTYVAPPTVSAISPTNGSTAGGTPVTITGTGFTGATGVTIGGTAATGISVVSATSITCTTAAHAAGTASVLVTTPGGTNAANTLFTYNTPPTFSGFTAATPYQTAATISLGKLMLNAADADGDAVSATSAGPSSTAGGSAVLQVGSILYTPPNGFAGTDTFPVTITDARGVSIVGTVTVTVQPNTNIGSNPPVLTPLSGNRMRLDFYGIPGRPYEVQRSTDLTIWQVLTTVNALPNGAVTFIDESPPPGNGYYRLRKP